MSYDLKIKLKSKVARSFAGHTVSALFIQKVTVDSGGQSLSVPREVSAPVAADGHTILKFPPDISSDASIRVRVLAPDGQVLKEVEVSVALVGGDKPVVIEVDAKEYFPIEHTTDPAFGKPARIRGLVVDPSGQGRVGNRQVVISARPATPAGAPIGTVAVARTDGQGYFSTVYPLGAFSEAQGSVDGGTPVPIRLGDDGAFPEYIVLGVELPRDDELRGKDECKCVSVVPRDPDVGDLVNAPETYSADVGGGHCVDITKPNRVLEEFDFHAVVRTTEPDIRGLTVAEPPKVGMNDIIRIVDPKIFGFMLHSQSAESLFASRETTAPQAETLRSASGARAAARTPIRGIDVNDPEALASYALITARPELEHLSEVIGLASLHLARLPSGVPQPQPQPQPGSEIDLDAVRIEAEIVKTLSRDPDGFSLTRLAQAEIATRKNDLVRLLDLIKRRSGGRDQLSCSNPVDWDDEPTFYQACTVAHGHILHFKQQWVADGYSLGDLLYSLPLAPCQKKQIAVIDWDRRESAARLETLEERELLSAHLSRDRDISEIANASVRESMSGGSEADTSSFGGGLGIGVILGPVGGLLGIGGGTSGASSSAWQNSSRSTSASSLQQLRDRTVQGASAVRNQRSTVIQTVRQGETMRVQTEVVANHNHCHAITIEYFEVLRHFLVRQHLADVQECLLVPLLISRFDSAKTRRWCEILRLYLRDRRLSRGFEALQRIADNYVGSDVPTGSYAEEQLVYLDGYLRIQFRIQRPRDNNDGTFLEASWAPLFWLGITPQEWWRSYLENQQERDRIFAEVLGPRITEEISNGLRFYAVDENDNETQLPVDPTLVSDFSNDTPLYVSLRLNDDLPSLRRDRIKFIKIATTVDTKAGPQNIDNILPTGSKVIIHSGQMGYRTAHIAHDLFQQSRLLNDLSGTDGVLIYTPLSRQELRRPREEDKEVANALLKHLNDYLEYYHRAIWWRMDPQRRYMLLDGFIAPNSGGRSVASVVENRLVGIVGNCLVMPVSAGFHLDPTFQQDEDNPIDLLEHYQPTTPVAPLRLAVPTKGVFAESVMGACNSCEKKDESRFWRWEESPCPDEPTPIQAVSTESRRAEPPDLTPQPFPQPIVAFQNVPAAPDPQGFGGLLQLLSNPNLFRDITGLTENQRNALAALQSALGTAQFFGGKAADLALQGNMRQDIDKALDKINEQHASGAINDQQRAQLTEAALRSMIGGGTESPSSNALTKEPEVKDAIRKASATPGGEINISRATGDSQETLGIKTPTVSDVGRSFIIEGADLTPDRRAFGPNSRDKAGITSLSVRVPRLPTGGSIRWSVPPPQAGRYTLAGNKTTQTGNRVEITALRPGLTEIDVEVRDAGGTVIESQKYALSIPQFVTVDVGPAFDALLTTFGLIAFEIEEVLRVAKETSDMILSTANVRTVWLKPPFNETLPAQFATGGAAAANVTHATFTGDPPAHALYGRTRPGAGGIGPGDFDEIIEVFAGAFDDAVAGNANEEVDDVTNEVVGVLVGSGLTSSPEKDLAIQVLGRLLGETLAHEIVHSLIGATLSDGGHNARPGFPDDLMNHGIDRSFQNRSGFELTGPVGSNDLTNLLVDRGIFFINIPTTDAQARLNATFPVPPAFT
jgi:hypothetical protein